MTRWVALLLLAQTPLSIPGVVAAGTKVQLIAEGLQGAEGLVAAPDGTLLFAEPNANRISRIDANGRVTPYLSNTNGTVALAFDGNGRLIAAQGSNPQIAVLTPTRDVLADAFDGQPLSRPNSLTVDRRGGIYFSDPHGILYIRPDGDVVRVAGDIESPGGLVLSPDEKSLYVANAAGGSLLAFDVGGDGSLAGRRDVARVSNAAGLTVDSAGRVYVATRGGVEVLSPEGLRLGTIPIDGAQSLAFGGRDRKTLFVVGRNAAWKIATQSQGLPGPSK
jgi:gluconolactonase